MLKELGDVIAKEMHTNLCPHQRIAVARAVVNWLSHLTPDEDMMIAAGAALGRLHREKGRGNHHPIDDFTIQFQAVLAEMAKEVGEANGGKNQFTIEGISVDIERGKEGLYYGTSPHVPGLLVARTTMQGVIDDVPLALEQLVKASITRAAAN